MNDYTRSGNARYGSPDDLARNVQTLTITKDRSFTFIIDKGDKLQSEMVSDAGEALARQLREVVVPEFDRYVFATLGAAATAHGAVSTTAIDKNNAYASFLAGMEYLGDHDVPDVGRVAFCSYHFANLMMQDPAFVKYSDKSQEMVIKGVMGEIDGCKVVKVASNRLPAGTAFIITHAEAGVGPKQLEDYRIHDDPPGISGWLVEGRTIYDCFVLNEKANAVYMHGGQSLFKALNVQTTPQSATKFNLLVNTVMDAKGTKWYYQAKTAASGFDALTFGSAITTGNFTEMKDTSNNPINHVEGITASTNKVVRVVEVDSENKPIAYGDTVINLG